jgi:16S rRNA (guanine527-N7)-methyltransferase
MSFDKSRFMDQWNVSRETIQRLEIYQKLLEKWQPKINLVSPTTMSEIWTRHFADSLQIMNLAPEAKIWADLGTGAGFPGLVLAICLPQQTSCVHLFESNGKKCAFLREVIRETGCVAKVHDGRIEDKIKLILDQKIDIVTARALASLNLLLIYVEELLTTGTRSLFLKGQDVGSELEEASLHWNFSSRLYPSQVDPRGSIIEICDLSPRSS